MAIESTIQDALPLGSALGGSQAPSEIVKLREELLASHQARDYLAEQLSEEKRINASLRFERDEYRRIIYPKLCAQIPAEELIHFAETCHLDDNVDLRDALAEMGILSRGEE